MRNQGRGSNKLTLCLSLLGVLLPCPLFPYFFPHYSRILTWRYIQAMLPIGSETRHNLTFSGKRYIIQYKNHGLNRYLPVKRFSKKSPDYTSEFELHCFRILGETGGRNLKQGS